MTKKPITKGYARYALILLITVYIFNFLDRTILSILAEDIKRDLGLTDSELGFLYGTAFAVFYSIFGVPLARLADYWKRGRLISIGLFSWSLMTALSGTARSLFSLAIYRFGVGIGESSASPAAYSLLSDYFSPRVRATVLALYSSGIYIGSGIGLILGGLVVDNWNDMYPTTDLAPWGLSGWQAAFFVVGAPGAVLAVLVWFLREPVRGSSEDQATLSSNQPQEGKAPVKKLFSELNTIVPPFNLIGLYQLAGTRGLAINLLYALAMALVCYGLYRLTGDLVQWTALGIGLYAAISWTHSLIKRDPECFRAIFANKAMIYGILGYSTMSFIGYGVGFWQAPLFIRVYDITAAEAGLYLGIASATCGFAGVTFGGWLSDRLKSRIPGSRPFIVLIAAPVSALAVVGMVLSPSLWMALMFNYMLSFFSTTWVGTAPSMTSELVSPHRRATAGSIYILINTFIGLALGPYCMGKMSDFFQSIGQSDAEALGNSLVVSCLILLASFTFALLSIRHYRASEERLRHASTQA